jgi:glycosyltransferase involved in cell wall biosynthesis
MTKHNHNFKKMIYLSPVPWNSFAQRPHRFVEWFHGVTGANVLWLDPYPARFPKLSDFKSLHLTKLPPLSTQSEKKNDWITVLKPRAIPIEPFSFSGKINGLFWSKFIKNLSADPENLLLAFGKPTELALQLLKALPGTVSLYDAMDDFPSFFSGLSRQAMFRREISLATSVDRVVTSSSALKAKFDSLDCNTILALNACSIDNMPLTENLPPKQIKPVVGYVGTVGAWFDWPLVIKMATLHSEISWRIIGPIHAKPPSILPHNIELLPACCHNKAIEYMSHFSVGLIPFKRTTLTESVDPIKFYEYAALGLPVLSTDFGEMAYRQTHDAVFLIRDESDPAILVSKALKYSVDISQIASFRRLNTWSHRFTTSFTDFLL